MDGGFHVLSLDRRKSFRGPEMNLRRSIKLLRLGEGKLIPLGVYLFCYPTACTNACLSPFSRQSSLQPLPTALRPVHPISFAPARLQDAKSLHLQVDTPGPSLMPPRAAISLSAYLALFSLSAMAPDVDFRTQVPSASRTPHGLHITERARY